MNDSIISDKKNEINMLLKNKNLNEFKIKRPNNNFLLT
jgi:hypothetical protein